jgi:hypothetical protein
LEEQMRAPFNLVFVAIIGFVVYAIHEVDDYHLRANISEAILACSQVKAQVNEFAKKNGRLPVSKAELEQPLSGSQYLKSIDLRHDATLVATLQGEKEFDGKVLLLRPALDRGKVIWVCGAADESLRKYLPASCRNKLPPDRASN